MRIFSTLVKLGIVKRIAEYLFRRYQSSKTARAGRIAN